MRACVMRVLAWLSSSPRVSRRNAASLALISSASAFGPINPSMWSSAYAEAWIMPTRVPDALVSGWLAGSGVGITRRVWRWLEVVEEREQGVGRPVAAGAGARLLDAGEGLFLDGHVGVEVDLGGLGVLVAEPEGDDRGVHAASQQ